MIPVFIFKILPPGDMPILECGVGQGEGGGGCPQKG